MLKISGASLELIPDPELLRPNDVPVRYGSSARLYADTGWQPEIPLEQTLRDILADYDL